MIFWFCCKCRRVFYKKQFNIFFTYYFYINMSVPAFLKIISNRFILFKQKMMHNSRKYIY